MPQLYICICFSSSVPVSPALPILLCITYASTLHLHLFFLVCAGLSCLAYPFLPPPAPCLHLVSSFPHSNSVLSPPCLPRLDLPHLPRIYYIFSASSKHPLCLTSNVYPHFLYLACCISLAYPP